MHVSEEILDHIFGYLVSHRETLIACSKDPYLSLIVKRYLYYHLIVSIDNRNRKTTSNYALKPDRLAQLVLEDPRILYNVRILEIQVELEADYWMIKALNEFANLLLMFPVLERIMITSAECAWCWPNAFRTALKDSLHLPTVKEAHISGVLDFPLSLLDNCNNLKILLLSGSFINSYYDSVSTLPRLQSLAVSTVFIDPPFMAWIKSHINELLSLKCMVELPSGQNPLSQLLGICSQTLKKLDVHLGNIRHNLGYTFTPGPHYNPLVDFTPVPPNLQQLTIRAEVSPSGGSWLPSAAKIINFFISSLKLERLVLDIDAIVSTALTEVDLSPLAVLVSASLSVPRIDLYVHTGTFPSAVTHDQLLCLLDEHQEIVRLIKEGVVVIHSEMTAPDE